MAFGWKDIRHFYHLSDLSSRATNKQKEIQVISYFNRDIKVPPLPSHLETKILIEIVQKEQFKSHILILTHVGDHCSRVILGQNFQKNWPEYQLCDFLMMSLFGT